MFHEQTGRRGKEHDPAGIGPFGHENFAGLKPRFARVADDPDATAHRAGATAQSLARLGIGGGGGGGGSSGGGLLEGLGVIDHAEGFEAVRRRRGLGKVGELGPAQRCQGLEVGGGAGAFTES